MKHGAVREKGLYYHFEISAIPVIQGELIRRGPFQDCVLISSLYFDTRFTGVQI